MAIWLLLCKQAYMLFQGTVSLTYVFDPLPAYTRRLHMYHQSYSQKLTAL